VLHATQPAKVDDVRMQKLVGWKMCHGLPGWLMSVKLLTGTLDNLCCTASQSDTKKTCLIQNLENIHNTETMIGCLYG